MSSLDRSLAADVLRLRLPDERAKASDPALLERNGRNARTLVKEGALRVTLVAVAPGGHVPEHHADGPITMQAVDGRLRVRAGGAEHELTAGDLLALAAGVAHEIRSDEGGAFLLTICGRGDTR
ncbi:MAG TPA: cupin domain-containing protein [Gemmatimonadaceae bacterium]|nr:cupin domain-containing protein [Gemmatimonadaceae bacterium]